MTASRPAAEPTTFNADGNFTKMLATPPLIKPLTSATRELFAPLSPIAEDHFRLTLDGGDPHRFLLQFTHGPDGEPRYNPTRSGYQLLERIPERRNSDKQGRPLAPGTWKIAATDFTAAVIAAAWPRSHMHPDPEAQIVFDYLLATLHGQNEIAEDYARYKATGEAPEGHGLEIHPDPDRALAVYQQVAGYNSVRSEGYALFMEQGTGKTPVGIAAICNRVLLHRRPDGHPFKVAIVCPSNVRMNWASELAKFSTRIGQATVLRGDALKRMDLLLDAMRCDPDDEFTAVIMSYDVLCESWRGLSMVDWDLAILDESHYIKTPTTRRYKYACKLRDRSAARMVLTGTPITNTPLDLYAQLEFLYKGGSGFNSWVNFRKYYGVYDKGPNGFEKLVSLKNLPLIQERLARMSFIVRSDDVLKDLPEKVYDIEEVEMTEQQANVYQQIATQLAAEVESMVEGQAPKQLLIENILTKLLRLAQITSGFVTWDAHVDDYGNEIKPKEIEHFDPSPKAEQLAKMLRDRDPLSKTIVWACWRPDIEAIMRRLRSVGIGAVEYHGGTKDADRERAEYLFNHDRQTTVFVGSQAAGGTGLNLLGYPPGAGDEHDTNCDWVIYYSQNWSPTQRSQSEKRAHRRGTRKPVRITDLCVPNTIDEEIRTRVMEKISTAMEVSDVRKILQAVLTGVA